MNRNLAIGIVGAAMAAVNQGSALEAQLGQVRTWLEGLEIEEGKAEDGLAFTLPDRFRLEHIDTRPDGAKVYGVHRQMADGNEPGIGTLIEVPQPNGTTMWTGHRDLGPWGSAHDAIVDLWDEVGGLIWPDYAFEREGFQAEQTGGGCRAWMKTLVIGETLAEYILVVSDAEAGIPVIYDQECLVEVYTREGFDSAGNHVAAWSAPNVPSALFHADSAQALLEATV